LPQISRGSVSASARNGLFAEEIIGSPWRQHQVRDRLVRPQLASPAASAGHALGSILSPADEFANIASNVN
jgi:hypothetical protein